MRRLCLKLVVTFAGVALVPGAFGQCPTGTVSMRGKVANLPSEATNVEVTVVLKTPKGDVSKTVAVTNAEFATNLAFSTLKSWSPLGGHHCSNLPKSVTVKVGRADQTLSEMWLSFKKSFEQQDANWYRLKQDLTIDLSKGSAGKP
jgi:hypothetical protein